MQLAMIGPGRMGANLVSRLMRDGHECVVFHVDPTSVAELDGFAGRLSDSGEGRWTVLAAVDVGAPAEKVAS
jgi:6-phosphogluconate dehydrogenase